MRVPLFLLSSLIGSLCLAQTASVQLTGTGCATTEGLPAMQTVGLPQLGATFELQYTGPNHLLNFTQSLTQPILVLGFSVAGPVTLPQTLFPQQPAGCTLLPAADVILPMMPSVLGGTQYESSFAVVVPNIPGLVGLPFFAQWFAVHTQCGFAGCGPGPQWIAVSETAACVIGT